MENISLVLEKLKSKRNEFQGKYYIPEIWSCTGFQSYSLSPGRKREIAVNPYDYMIDCIENHILKKAKLADVPYLKAIDNDICLENSIIYSMLPRMFTAWNHYGEKLCSGTFLKAICLLPFLKKMNVNIVYLLPVFEYSSSYKKGETGSPYSIKSIYKLDKSLHDDLLGPDSGSMVEIEFKAFVEACHIMGIRVMVDFVFRTVARDSDLIVEHPDWFYWIKLKYNKSFCAPSVEKFNKPTVVSEKAISGIYTCKNIKKYLSQFTLPPNEADPAKWEYVINKHNKTGENILKLIEEEYEITTAPGFSDVINDPQPPWSDATYLKFYFDSHSRAKQYIDKNQAPYILHDIAKLNLFRGDLCNTRLWNYTVNVIPYYQKNFGIDGARIDMGHALPQDLNREIIHKAMEINRHFLLWSEEFNYKNSEKAKENGFHFMTGSLWYEYKNISKTSFYKKVVGAIVSSAVPITGALESPDTPRAAYNYKGEKSIEMMVFINYFMPNIIPMINNGMEIMEIQPMNLGLDNSEEGRYVLEKDDPMYGKLAFFDNYKLHWTDPHSCFLPAILEKVSVLKAQFSDITGRKENFIYRSELVIDRKIFCLCYIDNNSGRNVFLLANQNSKSNVKVNFDKVLPKEIKSKKVIRVVYKSGKTCNSSLDFNTELQLSPKEVIVGFLS